MGSKIFDVTSKILIRNAKEVKFYDNYSRSIRKKAKKVIFKLFQVTKTNGDEINSTKISNIEND